MRVGVDRDLCQGHGVCCEEAPRVFRLDAAGELEIVEPSPPEEERARVLEAVRHCPTCALRLEE